MIGNTFQENPAAALGFLFQLKKCRKNCETNKLHIYLQPNGFITLFYAQRYFSGNR